MDQPSFPCRQHLGNDLTRLLLLSYLAAVAVFFLVFLLVTALYHPKKQSVPELSYPEAAQQLAGLAREVWLLGFRTHISSSVPTILMVIAAAFALFFAYSFYLQDADAVNAILSRFPTGDGPTNALLYVFFAYFILHSLCLPIVWVTRPLYRSGIPYRIPVETDAAALFAGEAAQAMTEEELVRQRQENAAVLREEGLRTEYQGRYHIAMGLYQKAALGGDIPAMEHYARHCLLEHQKEPARYWLEQAAASGNISPEGKNMLQRLKLGRNLNVGYLQQGVDSTLKAVRRRSRIQLIKNILSLVLFLGISAAVLAGTIRYLGGSEASFMAQMNGIFHDVSTEDPISLPEETRPVNIPLQTLTETGTPWEGRCIGYDGTGAPMVSCYTQDAGGSLTVPYCFPEGGQLHSAEVYFGNIWDIRNITQHVRYDDAAQAVVIAEAYLQSLSPGEYFILLNNAAHYIPLVVQERIPASA